MPFLDVSDDFKPYYEIHDYTDPWTKPEAIVFIHGFGERAAVWYGWIPHLARHYRVLSFDMRGFGRTGPVSSDFEYSTDLLANDVAVIIERLLNGPAHVVSAKSGSITAARLAAIRPDLVKSLILACPSLTAPGNKDWVPYIDEHGMREFAKLTMPARLGEDTPETIQDWWSDLMGEAAISTGHAYFRWVVTTDAFQDLKKTTCPILAIMTTPEAKNNTGAGQIDAERVTREVARAQVVLVELNCYHVSAVDPDLCAQTTLKFLSTLPR